MKGRKPTLKPVKDALAKVPKAPAWLTPEARQEWKRVAPDLVRRQILTADNLALLESYATAVGMVRIANAQIAREGFTVLNGSGGTQRHPAVQSLKDFMAEARRLAAELGLTPTSRNKVGTAPEEQDELSGLVD
jgi:P27 family predicted phage terminase small subunit